jgi:hypothetical protein
VATHTILLAGPGPVWIYGMTLWLGVVDGTYTAWSQSFTPDGDFRVWTITVTNPDTSTDDYVLVDTLTGNSSSNTLSWLVSSPGFRQPPPVVVPDVMPDASDSWRAFRDSCVAWRVNMFTNYTGAGNDSFGHDATGSRYGVVVEFYPYVYYKNLDVVVDNMVLMHGTLSGDSASGPPTDGVGAGIPVAISAGGGGGSVDLGPLTEAVESIADKDVDFKVNEGGAVWSIYGRVMAE